MESYKEAKETALSLVESVRIKDKALAGYLARHIRFNDQKQVVEYIGMPAVLKSLMARAIVCDESLDS